MCTVCVFVCSRLGTMDDGGNSGNGGNGGNSSGSMLHILCLPAPSAKMMMIFMVCIWKHNLLTVSYLMQINYNKLNTGNRFCLQNKTKLCVAQKANLVWEFMFWNDLTIKNYEITIERLSDRATNSQPTIERESEWATGWHIRMLVVFH